MTKMKQPKPAPIFCGDVVPGKIYLAPYQTTEGLVYQPVTIHCTQEPGWLRGFVSLDGLRATATVLLTGETVTLPVCRNAKGEKTGFMFANSASHVWPQCTLFELPPDYFERELSLLHSKIAVLKAKADKLADIQAKAVL